jgi:hypothetical protein
MRRQRQCGEGRLGLILSLAVVSSGIFVAVKVVPVRISAYEFKEALREEAKYASVRRDDTETFERIMEKAASLHLPLSKDQVAISRTQSEVIIKAKYEQPIDLKVTTYTYRFNAEMRAPTF